MNTYIPFSNNTNSSLLTFTGLRKMSTTLTALGEDCNTQCKCY